MKWSWIGIAAAVYLVVGSQAVFAERLYDLGPVDGQCWPGAEPVSEGRGSHGFSWVGGSDREAVQRLQPDPLSADFVRGTSDTALRFNLDVPAGEHRISLLLGDTGADRRRLPRFYRERVVVRIGGHEQTLLPAPDWPFRLLSLPDVGGPSFWERYFESRFRWVDAVVVGGRVMPVEVGPGWAAPLCAVHVAADGKRLTQWREDLQRRRQAHFAARGWRPAPDASPPSFSVAEVGEVEGKPYTVHTRHWMEEVVPSTPPAATPHPLTLRVAAAPGEMEPVTLAITPHRKLSGCAVSVSDLSDADGRTLLAAAIRVGWVRYQDRPSDSGALARVREYRKVPYVVLPLARLDFPLAVNVTRRLWLTVTIPDGQAAGIYSGVLTLRFAGVPSREIPLRVEVRPVQIGPTPGEAHFFYFHGPGAYDRVIHPGAEGRAYEAAFLRDAAVMTRYGFTMTNLVLPPEAVEVQNGDDVTADLSTVERKLALWRRAQVVPEDGRINMVLLNLVGRFGGRWHQVQGGPGSHVVFSRRPVEQQRFREFARWLGKAAHGRLGWPELLFECGGELTNYRKGGEGRAWGETVYRLLRAADVRTALRGNGPVDLAIMEQGLVDVAILNHRMVRSDILARLRKRGVEIWLYNFGQDRFNFGVLAWAVGATRTGHEGFQVVVGEPFNDWDGLIRDWGTAQPTPEGPVPTIGLIHMAEGIDDYRYLRTLELRLAELTKRGEESAAITRATAFLEQTRRDVHIDLPENRGAPEETAPWPMDWWQYHRSHGWSPERLDALRGEAVTHLLALEGGGRER